jgi:hypothetical protein
MKLANPMKLEVIPELLKVLPQWVAWRREEREGKPTKVPYDPKNGALAKVNDAATWSTFQDASACLDHYDGIGFVLTPDDPFVGVDLDHVVDPVTGKIAPWALTILDQLHSYTEISPSGTGLRIFVQGTLPLGGRRKGPLELYDAARYLTVTGHHVAGTPTTIEPRHETLQHVHAAHFPIPPVNGHEPRPTQSVDLDDQRLLDKMLHALNGEKVRGLWNGNWSLYPSQSEGDMALCHHLAFWCGRDEARMDRLFRQSGLMREKWDAGRGGGTYGEETIAQACARCPETYSPSRLMRTEEAGADSTGDMGESIHAAPGSSPTSWPVLHPEALHGLAGEVVTLFSPHTEADPVALLIAFISEFGCVLGRAPHLILDGSYHPLSVWPVLIGQSSKARKGSSDSRIQHLYHLIDDGWTRGQYRGTLSSGEGLAHAVRDPSYEDQPIKDKGRPTGEVVRVQVDAGVEDKRLFLVQSEFGAMLKIMAREGNSLSGVLRDAWDGKDLAPMTKSHRVRATAPHIVLVGHTTQAELQKNLCESETTNGFGNRFLYLLVKRSKLLPFSSSPDQTELHALVVRIRAALQVGRTVSRVEMTESARTVWRAVYPDLSTDRPGLVGCLLARAESQVLRLAAIFTLLDAQRALDVVHLKAALALWQYAEHSTTMIFAEATGNADADVILRALRTMELTDSQISDLFGRHRSQARLDQAKLLLQVAGVIHPVMRKTEGRPQRVWRAGKAPGPGEET